MPEHPIVEWYSKDKMLADLLVSIDQETLDPKEAATKAFYKVAELYELPKFPEGVNGYLSNYDVFNEPAKNISLFEQLAIHKAIFPESDIRGSVLAACLAVYKRFYYTLEEAAAEHYGTYDNIPLRCYVYFIGKDIDAKLKFSKSVNSKFKKEARSMELHIKED